MSPEETESYLSSVEEYVFDEKKIVACSWLSKVLGIHSNLSKQLLYTFYENNSKKGELCATYLLIGVSNEGSTQVLIVQDKDLQEVESSLKSISSKHIYSVQKCAELSDLSVLYAAQKGENIDKISKGLSAIDFNCNERDSSLIAKLRCDALPSVSNQPSAFAKKTNPLPPNKSISPKKVAKDEKTGKNTNSVEKKESETKSEGEKVVVPSMFKNNPAPKKKTAGKAPVNNKNSKGIGAFFSKTSKPINEPKPKTIVDDEKHNKEQVLETKTKERLSPLKENKATLNICDQNKSNPKKDDPPQEAPIKTKKTYSKPSKGSKKGDTKRSSKKNAVKKVEKDDKKRKRLVVLSDSDSSNASEDEEEVQREPTPEPEPTVVPDDDDDDIIHGTPEPSRKRKKKLVSKTFMTPDGYMVTEKEAVEVSGSEDEEGVPEKKLKPSATDEESVAKNKDSTDSKPAKSTTSEKKVSPKGSNPSPNKTKQASLMNFFKKK